MKYHPPIERLHQLLTYDASTGDLIWLQREGAKKFNSNFAGKPAGYLCRGYITIKLDGANYRAHRVVYAMFHGVWPENQIDHIDGDRSNNLISNLRDVTQQINIQNQRRPHKNNKTGYLGVKLCDGAKGFAAQITVNGVARELGRFSDPSEAHQVYIKAKRALHDGNTL